MKCHGIKIYLCALLGSAVLVTAGCQGDATATQAKLGEKKVGAASLVKEDVATTVAQTIKVPQELLMTGSLAADEASNVAAKRGGIVKEVLVDRGSVVKMGDVMVRLDTTDATNSLNQAEAAAAELMVRLGLSSSDENFSPEKQPDVKVAKVAYELAQRNFDRDQKLFQSKVISTEEFDKTRNEYLSAKQRYDLAVAQASQLFQQFQTALTKVKSARQLVQDMTVHAPYDGAVVEKLVSPGEAVMDGARVMSLVRINPLRLLLNVPEQDVGRIDEGQTVLFAVDAFPGQTFRGTVKRIAPSLDINTRTLTVEAEVPNKDGDLKPGLFASARVELGTQKTIVRVPDSAVRRKGEDVAQVFVVDDGIARATMVVASENRRGFVDIMQGLKGGETIVSDAAQVEDGVRVQ